jgi:hypothetical protein
MKAIIIIAVCLFMGFVYSCGFKGKELDTLNKISKISLSRENISVINYEEKGGGISEEGTIEAAYGMRNLNADSMAEILNKLGYQRLPFKAKIQIPKGFYGYAEEDDYGFYKAEIKDSSIIDKIVVVNFSKQRIIVYSIF